MSELIYFSQLTPFFIISLVCITSLLQLYFTELCLFSAPLSQKQNELLLNKDYKEEISVRKNIDYLTREEVLQLREALEKFQVKELLVYLRCLLNYLFIFLILIMPQILSFSNKRAPCTYCFFFLLLIFSSIEKNVFLSSLLKASNQYFS